jgi:hypothetical protein
MKEALQILLASRNTVSLYLYFEQERQELIVNYITNLNSLFLAQVTMEQSVINLLVM